MVLPNTHFNSCSVVAIVRSKSEDEAEYRVTYVLGTYKIINKDENGKPKVVVIETTQKGKNRLYGFYKGFKIIPRLVENREENEAPWEDVIDENVKLLKCHKLMNVRLG